MKIALVDIKKDGDNKDFNGGFGTTFQIGKSIPSRVLSFLRGKLENLPTLSYVYIAGICKKYNHSVKYYLNEIPDSADLILIHVSLIRYNEEINFIKKMKQKGLNNIGVYGPIASVKPEFFKDADFVLKGEPEQAIINIFEMNKVPKGVIESKPIEDLDSLPYPDWSCFPVEDYSLSPAISKKPTLWVHASRGCPYKCSYCPYLVFGKYRARKPEKVIEELKYLKEKYNIKGFFFRDPTFSINHERIKKLAELMIKEELNLEWGCETRLDLLDISLLNLLYKAGLRAIKVGVESVDHDLLKKYKRLPPEINHQEKIINFCKKIGIRVIAFYIIGIPTDTKETIKNTINYSRRLNTSFANFTICTPIPGTDFYEEIKEKISDNNFNHYDNFHVVFKHDNLTSKEILDFQEKAITGYYFRLKYILMYFLEKIKIK